MATGKVIQITGPVIDVEFPPGELPNIYNALEISVPSGGDGTGQRLVVEVQQLDQVISWARGVQPVFAVLAALAGAASALFAFLRFREEKKRSKIS